MPSPFVSAQRLRMCDCDPLGHVNNAVYAVLYEAGRVEMLHPLGLTSGSPVAVIARLEIDFLREMTWPGDVVIETGIARFGTKSLHVRQRLTLGGTVVSRAASVLAFIDAVTRKAVPLAPGWIEALANYQVSDGELT